MLDVFGPGTNKSYKVDRQTPMTKHEIIFRVFSFIKHIFGACKRNLMSQGEVSFKHPTYMLKCMSMIFNILLNSKVNILLCTDLIFTAHLFIC